METFGSLILAIFLIFLAFGPFMAISGIEDYKQMGPTGRFFTNVAMIPFAIAALLALIVASIVVWISNKCLTLLKKAKWP